MTSKLVILLCYWGGNVCDGPEGVFYNKPPSKAIKVQPRIKFNELINQLHVATSIDKEKNCIKVICRFPSGFGKMMKYIPLPITDDDDIEIMFQVLNLYQELSTIDLYLEVETQRHTEIACRTQKTSLTEKDASLPREISKERTNEFSPTNVVYEDCYRAVSSIVPSPDNSGPSPVPNTSSSSSGQSSRKYDVFLSFRGEDTRKTFVDHLYNALVERTIYTYKDDETLPRGDTIGPSLLKAIQESHIALIVFSKNYANSSWCLDELAYIMKCKDERGKIVIPIFYDVVPSDVRKLKGQFGEAFSKLNNKSTNNEKVQAWRTALVGASDIAGWETKVVANGFLPMV